MKRFKNILYINDPAVQAGSAFERAVALAEENKARLTVAEVAAPIPFFVTRQTPHKLRALVKKQRKSELKALCDSVKGRVKAGAKFLEGKFILEIVRDVLRAKRDLVIKTAQGRGGAFGKLFGSEDMQLLRKCPCPVWLIKSSQKRSFKKIVVAVDFDEAGDSDVMDGLNRQILEMAYALAQRGNCSLDIVHVWDATLESFLVGGRVGLSREEIKEYVKSVRDENQAQFKQLMAKAETWIGSKAMKTVEVRTHLVRGQARVAIARKAGALKADLLIMGTVARTGVQGFFMGNTAEAVLDRIGCSVLAVKPPGFATPVTLDD